MTDYFGRCMLIGSRERSKSDPPAARPNKRRQQTSACVDRFLAPSQFTALMRNKGLSNSITALAADALVR